MATSREDLWLFDIDFAVYMHNHLPISNMWISPTEHFTNTGIPNFKHLTWAHTFGCPVYILDPRLQDSKKFPTLSMRSRNGIYLGVSITHSSTVHLVLNPETGVVSQQYHCVFKDIFTSVCSDGLFIALLLEHLVQRVDNHFSVDPNSDGHVNLPNDFIPFDLC